MKFNGTTYIESSLPNTGHSSDPITRAHGILYVVVNNKPIFHVEVLETVEYCSHFHCYIVQLSSREVYVPGSDLLSYVPLLMHTLPGRCHVRAIVPKHRLLTVD